MAQWMRAQTQEEIVHAMKFFDHLKDRDGRVEMRALAQPEKQWASPLAAFQAAYGHEQFITGKINDLVKLAQEEGDHAAGMLLQWFVNEQVEEEDNVSKVLGQLKLIKDSSQALFMMDKEMAQRVFTPPATQGEQ